MRFKENYLTLFNISYLRFNDAINFYNFYLVLLLACYTLTLNSTFNNMIDNITMQKCDSHKHMYPMLVFFDVIEFALLHL